MSLPARRPGCPVADVGLPVQYADAVSELCRMCTRGTPSLLFTVRRPLSKKTPPPCFAVTRNKGDLLTIKSPDPCAEIVDLVESVASCRCDFHSNLVDQMHLGIPSGFASDVSVCGNYFAFGWANHMLGTTG